MTTAARLVKVSADSMSIASSLFSLRMFFLKSFFFTSALKMVGKLGFIDGRIAHKPLLSPTFSMEISLLQPTFFFWWC